MSRKFAAWIGIGSLLLTGALWSSALAADPAAGAAVEEKPTADELLARYVKALGGRDKLKAIRSMRMEGTMFATGGFKAKYQLELKRPNSVRTEVTINGAMAIQASDGTKGWMIKPGTGSGASPSDPIPLTPSQLEGLQQSADIDGPLVDPKEKGFAVEVVGKEPVGTKSAWNLKLTDKEGVVRNFFLDTLTYFPIQETVHKTVEGKDVDSEMRLGDYRETGGVRFPYLLESANKTGFGGQRLVLDKIEINPELPPERFAMPRTNAAPAAKDAEPKKPPAGSK